MGEETRMNLDTSYYNGEKTEYTVDHRTQISNGPHVKNEQSANEATHYEMGTNVAERDNIPPQQMHN